MVKVVEDWKCGGGEEKSSCGDVDVVSVSAPP